MTSVEILGWAAAVAAVAIGVPQAFRLLRTRSTAGLSVMMWQVILGLNLGWFVHGVVIDALNMIVPNAFSAVVSVTVLLLIRRERRLNPLTLFLVSGLVAAVMVAADLVLGSTGFGVVALLGSLIANTGQAIKLVHSPDISGVSPGYLLAQLVNQVLWLAWARLVEDSGTLISTVSTGLIVLFSSVWWLMRRFGLRPLFVQTAAAEVVPGETAQVVCES